MSGTVLNVLCILTYLILTNILSCTVGHKVMLPPLVKQRDVIPSVGYKRKV